MKASLAVLPQAILVRLAAASQALAEAKTAPEVKTVRDAANAVRVWLKSRGYSVEAINHATMLSLRAERRLGELTKAMEKQTGGDAAKIRTRSHDVTEFPPTYRELGIEKMAASRWQALADIPVADYEATVTRLANVGEVTLAGVLADFRAAQRETELANRAAVLQRKPLPTPAGVFDVIVIDPPWPYGTTWHPETRRGATPYPEMPLNQIAALPIPGKAEPDCVLWLWTTNAFLHEAFHIVEGWGFTYKNLLTWAKNKVGVGEWLRGQTEHCLLCSRGAPTITHSAQSTLLTADAREHSRKPDEFYALVESLCPGTKLEFFAREPREGWQAFGDETTRFPER